MSLFNSLGVMPSTNYDYTKNLKSFNCHLKSNFTLISNIFDTRIKNICHISPKLPVF